MSGCYGHPEPSLLQLKAAVSGHLPADMCNHNNDVYCLFTEGNREKPHNLSTFLDLVVYYGLTHYLKVGRWQSKSWRLSSGVGVILLGTLRRGLPTAQFRATIFQKTFPPTEYRGAWWTQFPWPCNSRVLKPFCPVCSTPQIKAQMFPLLTLSVAPLEYNVIELHLMAILNYISPPPPHQFLSVDGTRVKVQLCF